MDIRKVQRTGDMHYVYLPTAWCKEYKISGDSTVNVSQGSGGDLVVSPRVGQKKASHLKIHLSEDNLDIINKIVLACYINPADSFVIDLEKPLDDQKLLEQKRIISTELVEIEGSTIRCESFVDVSSCETLLKTMVSKIKNILTIMGGDYNQELVQRYEEEIDKNRVLITKSVISSLTHNRPTKLKTIDLHYISLTANALERLADHLIQLDRTDKKFFGNVNDIMSMLKDTLSLAVDAKKRLSYTDVLKASQAIYELPESQKKDIKSYHKERVRNYLLNIIEILFDWAITNELEQQST